MSLELIHSLGQVGLHGAPILDRRRFGVPPAGAFDQESYQLAVALARQSPGIPAWEIALGMAEFIATDHTSVAVAGAIGEVRVDGELRRPGSGAHPVRAGSTIRVGVGSKGCRAYVLAGRWYPDPVTAANEPQSLARPDLTIVPGPQQGLVDADLHSAWTVTSALDRVGIRLAGPAVPHLLEMVSEPACPGAVQVANDGSLIILGPDGPTIGGYPKVAVVTALDLNSVAQLRPGDPVRFLHDKAETRCLPSTIAR